jgi:phospholipase/carboxylesterase
MTSERRDTMAAKLDGPRRPARRGRATSLVVLLHGYGASGDDLIPLADELGPLLPDAAFASPNAVEQMPYPGQPAYQWFALTARDPEEYAAGARAAAPPLDAFLEAELARDALPPTRLALVGFSQGTMMSLHVGLRRKVAPAAIVGMSGVIAAAASLSAEIACRPPVMLIHGSDDEVIPVGAIHLTREALATNGIAVEWHIRDGLGHGIDGEGLRLAASFLAQRLR